MPGILQGWYGPFPQTMQAQAVDSSGNIYYGESSRGSNLSRARWSIYQMFYTTSLGTGGWVTQFPVDPTTGVGSDQPIFKMSSATNGTYTYASLGVPSTQSP